MTRTHDWNWLWIALALAALVLLFPMVARARSAAYFVAALCVG